MKKLSGILALILVAGLCFAQTSTKIDLSTQSKSKRIVLIGNATQSGMDPNYAPQSGRLTVLNNAGSDTSVPNATNPGGYALTAWSLSTNAAEDNSTVGLYGIGEAILESGKYGNIKIGPQGAQLDGISSPAEGAEISSVKGVQAIGIHNGAGTTDFVIGADVLSPAIAGGTVNETVGVHIAAQSGATTNYGLGIDGSYSGADDFAVLVNSTTARSFFGVINFGPTAGIADTGISRVGAGSVGVGDGTAGNTRGTLAAGTIVEAISYAPSSSNAAGVTGQIAWDANYIFICTAPNTWKRAATSSW
jgi:hypothetical protein